MEGGEACHVDFFRKDLCGVGPAMRPSVLKPYHIIGRGAPDIPRGPRAAAAGHHAGGRTVRLAWECD